MANHDIQKSKQLLKRLEEEMIFLSSLMSQAQIVSSNLKGTWMAIEQTHKGWKRDSEEAQDKNLLEHLRIFFCSKRLKKPIKKYKSARFYEKISYIDS